VSTNEGKGFEGFICQRFNHAHRRSSLCVRVPLAVGNVRYRVVALLMDSSLKLGHKSHGEVCNQQWAYFDYNAGDSNATAGSGGHRRRLTGLLADSSRSLLSAAASGDYGTHGSTAVHLSVHVWRYSGAFHIRLAHGYAPIKLVPPFIYLGKGDADATVQLCDIGSHGGSDPETVFIGLRGAKGCSMFDVTAHTYIGGNCTEPRNFAEVDVTEGANELELEHFAYGSCTPGGFSDFYLNLTAAHAGDNINFEVEQLGDISNMEALTVS
jgi:hypothetical protein